jgi:hypothetical protein
MEMRGGSRCKHEGCQKQPSYGLEGERPQLCLDHKVDGMVNTKGQKCKQAGCKRQPSFGIKEGKMTHCSEHKEEGMVSLHKEKHCLHEGCTTRPSYALKGQTSKYCAEHKLEGMVDVNHNTCQEEGCDTRACFGIEGTTDFFCKTHKTEEMIDLFNMKCEHDDCDTQPTFGFQGESSRFCVSHKLDGMADFQSRRPKCPGPPEHKVCPYDHIVNLSRKKYDGYCTRCFLYAFPDDERAATIYKHTAEDAMVTFLFQRFKDVGFVHDKKLCTRGCNCTHLRRIDMWAMVVATMLAVECDEYQHKYYDKADEEARYNDLGSIHSGNWVYIRFNPHPYKDASGKLCDPAMKDRLEVLGAEVEKQLKRIRAGENIKASGDLVEIVRLFYDGY